MNAMGGVAGLYLRIGLAGSKSWVLRITLPNGKRADMGLGSYPTLTLAAAREAARGARRWCSTPTTGLRVFRGACTRGIHERHEDGGGCDPGRQGRDYHRRFQQMCGHYLVEPVACTPAAGWEKGQVENQVGPVQQRFFSPRVRMKL